MPKRTQRQRAAVRRQAYVAAVIGAGALVLVGSLVALRGHDPTGGEPTVFTLLAALLLIGEMRPMRWLDRRLGGEITVTWSFACALLLLAPLGSALGALVVASVAGDVLSRKPLERLAFNASQLVLSLAAGAAVLDVFGARFALAHDPAPHWWWLPIAVLAGAAVYTTNGLLVTAVIALHQDMPLTTLMRSSFFENLSTDGMLLALAPVYVSIAREDLVLFPLLLLTALAIFVSARLALARQYEATHDQLTALPNRRVLYDHLRMLTDRVSSRDERIAVLLVDLDGFKEINDRLGHRIGDAVLQDVARRLSLATRPGDTVARLGGDEFAILVRRINGSHDVERVAQRIAAALHEPCVVDGFPVVLGASVGAAMAPDHGDDAQTLIERADVAMYAAKRERLLFHIYEPQGEAGPGRVALLGDLQRAVQRNDLALAFQPIVRLSNGEVAGVEALLRWHHPRWGLIAPMEFMPLAEQTDLVSSLTRQVIEGALRSAAQWHREGHERLVVAVNGSARNLLDLDFPDHVEALLSAAGVEPCMLELEITENAVLSDPTRVRVVLRALRAIGVRLAIDDFGTGFSSLVHLRDLPVDRVKIDKCFVHDLRHSRGASIVGPIIQLAHNLDVEAVAEGVEDVVTLSQLRDLGCDYAQGFALAAPASAAEITHWLENPTVILPTTVAPA